MCHPLFETREGSRRTTHKIKILHGSWTLFVSATLLSFTYYSRNCSLFITFPYKRYKSLAKLGARSFGVDISEERVEEAKQRADRSGDDVSRLFFCVNTRWPRNAWPNRGLVKEPLTAPYRYTYIYIWQRLIDE